MVKPRKIQIGKFQADNVKRELPNMDRFKKWYDQFLNTPELKDYDAYLWGSFPENENTRDIDILLTQGEGFLPTTQEMEELSVKNLEASLVNNNMLVDMGFTDGKIRPFQETMNVYNSTGKPVPTDGYVYGHEWYVDDEIKKNRSNWTGPFAKKLDNNMMHLGGAIPYSKQLNKLENYGDYYSNKPIKIKERSKSWKM